MRRNWARTLITVFGIALGVSVYLSITLANHSAINQFKNTVDEISGKSNVEITPRNQRQIDERLLSELDWVWLIGGKFSPVIDVPVALPQEGKQVVKLLGLDMLGDRDFRAFGSNENNGIEGDGSEDQNSILKENTAFVGGNLAERLALHKGGKLELLIDGRIETLEVAGVLGKKGLGGAFSGDLVVTDIGTAQNVLAMKGKISRIQLIVPDDAVLSTMAKLKEQIPSTLSADRPSARTQQVEKMTRSFEYNLLALTFIALMVGMFLIYSTMTISIIRRRSEIGTMRALGVRKWQIFSCFLMEALALSCLGTIAGIAAGVIMADGALKAVSATIQHFYFRHPAETLHLDWHCIIQSAFLGITLTTGAALPAVMEATSVSPAEAMRRASYESRALARSRSLAALSLAAAGFAWLAALKPPIDGFPVFGFVSAFLSIAAASLMVPAGLKQLLPLGSRFLNRLFPGEGKLAARSLYGTMGRTSVAVASLMIGIAMMVSLAIMIGSFRQTVTVWVDQTLKADLWLQSAARAHGSADARLNESVVSTIKRISGVKAVDGFVEMPFEFNGQPTNIAGADMDVVAKHGKLMLKSGKNTGEVLSEIDGSSCIVSESFALRKGIRRGDKIIVPAPAGNARLTVLDVYYDYASDLGYIIMPRREFYRLFDESGISSAAIYIEPGQDADRVRERIVKALDARVMIRTTGELRREAMRVFDRTFSITYALHTIAIAIAILTVFNSLMALTLESRREFGILRYLGASAAQMRKIVLIQAGILGFAGNTAGLFLGVVLSLLLIHVINKQSFGWTVQFLLPFDFLAQSSIAVFVTALLAGLLPARLAAKTPAPDVVREE